MTSVLDLSANERRLLDVIWRKGPIARAELATLAGFTGPSVTRVTQRLTELGLISETVNRAGLRGQPTRPVHIARDGAYAVGVYFSHSHVEIGLMDLAGDILHTDARPLAVADAALLGEMTADFIATAGAAHGVSADRIVGVGLALPGDFIRGARQINAHSFFPALGALDALAAFAAAVPIATFIENDAASAALGERILGVGQNIDTFVLVHIGHGVGGGVMLNGQLHRGVSGNAGMIGIQFPNDQPRPSGQDLLAHLRRAGVEVADFPDLEALHINGCPPLRAWVRRAGEQLREQLAITARLFDPEAMVIGGRLPLAILQALVAEIDNGDFCNEGVGLPRPRVVASSLGPRGGVIGAASIPLVRLLLDQTSFEAAGSPPGLLLTAH